MKGSLPVAASRGAAGASDPRFQEQQQRPCWMGVGGTVQTRLREAPQAGGACLSAPRRSSLPGFLLSPGSQTPRPGLSGKAHTTLAVAASYARMSGVGVGVGQGGLDVAGRRV